MSTTPTPTSSDRWQMLGGERFYTFARWLIILLLVAIIQLLTAQPFWPISAASPPLILALWAYGIFGLLTTIALFIPPIAGMLGMAYIFDIVFIALMTFFGGETRVIFFPLFLLPLTSAALRQSPGVSLASGLAAALAYVAASLAHQRLVQAESADVLEYVSLGLRALALITLPWLTSGLAERWSANNRRSVALAQEQAEQAYADARVYRDQMRSLYQVAYNLSSMDYRQILDATLREGRKLASYQVGLVLLSSGGADELYIAAQQGLSPADAGRSVALNKGSLAAALRASEAQTVADISRDPDLASFESFRNCRTTCIIPLRVHLRTYGLMVIALGQNAAFSGEQMDMLTTLANYAIIALHNAQLIFDLKEERNKLISKEEQVRHQLARDLHDGPAQSLAAITMNLEFIRRLLDRDPKRVIEELEKLSALSKRTTYEVRTMLFELRPLVLETQGLKVTLEQYLDRLKPNNSSGTQVILEGDDIDHITLETKTEGTLFNIIQECVNNALKHAKARHIWVRLKRQGNTLVTVVQDDGVGFDKGAVMRSYEKRGSFGLLNIDERARLVGGHSTLESTPGQGTVVNIVVPIEQ